MRIVAGYWKGRKLAAPAGMQTRPTSDRVREALFSSLASRLGDDLGGTAVLDLFAGTGALGFEALSRGATTAVFVEHDPKALRALHANVGTLEAGPRIRIVAGEAARYVSAPTAGDGPFGLLFLDPPYRIDAAEVRGLIDALADRGFLEPGCVIVWERASEGEADWPPGIEPVSAKRYGDTTVDLAVWRGGRT